MASKRDLCEAHYTRWRRHGDVKAEQPVLTMKKRHGALMQILSGKKHWRG